MTASGTMFVLHGKAQMARGTSTKMAAWEPVDPGSRLVTKPRQTEYSLSDRNKTRLEDALIQTKITSGN